MADRPTQNRPTDPKPKRTASYIFFSVLLLCLLAIGGVAVSTFSDTLQNAVIVKEDGTNTTAPPATTTAAPVAAVTAETTTAATTTVTTTTTTETTTPPAAPPLYTCPLEGGIIAPFSDTPLFNETMADHRVHLAVDLGGNESDTVAAFSNGTVTETGNDVLYGDYLIIDHQNGITSKYCGLQVSVAVGDTVQTGDPIGKLTKVPFETHLGPHLHFAVYQNGQAIDPSALWSVKS